MQDRMLSSIVAPMLVREQTLAAVNILQTLQNILHVLGYPAVVLVVMIESAGIPVPGETMLLLAAFYAAVDHSMQIPIVIICAALGAIIGDNIGYSVGRSGGHAILARYGKYIHVREEHMQRAQRFFEKHGNKTVFLGRFVAVLRAWAAFLAGVNKMRWNTFFFYNAAGGIIWATIYGLLGYFAGKFFHDNFNQVEHLAGQITWILAAVIIVGAIIAFTYYTRKKRTTRHSQPL